MSSPASPPSVLATRRGKLVLALLCLVAFLDFVDGSIVNIALPSIQRDLHLSVSNLTWVPSAYLLTYGGFMLLGGRAADLLGRRRVLVIGTLIVGISSAVGGFADTSALLIGARLAQGVGAALMLPAALSILTTTFREGPDRHTALGVWGGTAGLASATGVFLGGVLTQGPGWRWVFYVNSPVCVLVLLAAPALLVDDRRNEIRGGFDLRGSILITGSLLLLVYGLVQAPTQGWGDVRTLLQLGGAAVLLIVFLVNERFTADPLVALSIFRIKGLTAANVTYLIAVAGLLSMFFFATLYVQEVLGFGELAAGAAFLPASLGIGLSSAIAPKLFARLGTRPVIVAGAVIAGIGILMLSRMRADGTYLVDVLPGLLVMAFGTGGVFVGITTVANAGVPANKAGLAAALLNTSQQLGGALGIAILTAIATAHTNTRLAAPLDAMTAGFQRALLLGGLFILVAAAIALRTTNSHGEVDQPATEPTAATPADPLAA